jgi:glycerate-2-kinase
VRGETRDVARSAVKLVTDSGTNRNCALIGGETTVALPPDHGKGGRNTEFVLAALIELEKTALKNFVVLSGGTDGEDGPTDVAGAIGDDTTLSRARSLALDPADFLRRHDSYSLFDATGDLIRTGFTGTNVMDVRVLLIGQK